MNGMVIRPQDGDSLNLLMGNKGQRLQHTWDIFMSPERRAQQAWGSSPWEHSSKLCETRIRGDKLTNRDEVGGACAAEEHPPSPRPKEENFQRWHFFLFLSFNCVGGVSMRKNYKDRHLSAGRKAQMKGRRRVSRWNPKHWRKHFVESKVKPFLEDTKPTRHHPELLWSPKDLPFPGGQHIMWPENWTWVLLFGTTGR